MGERLSIRNEKDRIREYIRRNYEFRTGGQLKAIPGYQWNGYGRLPMKWRRTYNWDNRNVGIRYVVMSHDTPIAWVRRDREVVIPDVEYSKTTTGYQNLVREALGV